MKLLTFLLLFVTTEVLADIKVNVTKNSNITNRAEFENQQLAEAWTLDNEKLLRGRKHRNSFGLVERWLKVDHGNSIETREVEVELGENYTEYKYPQDYTIEYSDITLEVNEAKAKKELKDKNKKDMIDIIKTQDLNLIQMNKLIREMI